MTPGNPGLQHGPGPGDPSEGRWEAGALCPVPACPRWPSRSAGPSAAGLGRSGHYGDLRHGAQVPYRRVADDLRAKIESGKLAGQLRGRSKLAEEYGVADMTVGRPLDVRKDEGLVYAIAGLGVFVRER